MNVDELPVVSDVVEAGPDDRVFDGLLLVGPFVIALIVLLGDTVVTQTLGGTYVATVVGYVLYRSISSG